ncbi:MAG: anthranilate phosphoribosyltransferase [candidate division Zixibacteria bacterium]|nr:anthranilate phosphoribosyltransferase [candidate division Zixibacteria bacterium]
MIQDSLKKLLSGTHLTEEEATALMDQIMTGEATPVQIGGILIALKQKGELAHEVAGFVRSMRKHVRKVSITDPDAVDGCGTGGDGAHTFNISTAAAIVAAAAGATVAKHGNRSVSSKCGSADLLEAAGGKIDLEPLEVSECIKRVGFGFMFAPVFHPAMRYASGPRRELGVRTVFNILGPMTNPAAVKRQVIGVYDRSLMRMMAEVLALTGSVHVLVVHSRDGMDELSISDASDFVELKDGTLSESSISPESAGLVRYPRNAVAGGDAAENLVILRNVLAGSADGYGDAVALNAGALLYVAGKAESIREGALLARQSLGNGSARAKLDEWVRKTQA